MTDIVIDRLEESSIRALSDQRNTIQVDPPYQRMGEIWPLTRRRLLIDSILRGYDIPKLYFRRLVPAQDIDGRLITHAVIDGRQRLETLWAFLDDEFHVPEIESGGFTSFDPLKFSDLRYAAPDVAKRFLDFVVDVVTVETGDLDLIEDMFLRLNEAAPLNAAEKRNAFGGPVPPIYKRVCKHPYFADRLPFGNRRYRHYDMATKFLYFEDRHGVADTKKTWLDRFVRTAGNVPLPERSRWESDTKVVLDAMCGVFLSKDPMLTSVGMSSVYYLVFRQAHTEGWGGDVDRAQFEEFEHRRAENRAAAKLDESDADYDLLEFDRFAQSPNDAIALRFRRNVLLEFLGHAAEATGEDE